MKIDFNSENTLAGLVRKNRIASLGTVRDSVPNVSMVQYCESTDFTSYYIHISRLARHTQNINDNPHVSLMISESDNFKKDPQTLARISLVGEAGQMDKSSKNYSEIRDKYLTKFPGSTINFQLGDFEIYEIKITAARFVAGFGKIFNLHKEDLIKASQV